MTNLVPITKSHFLNRKWFSIQNYKFASNHATATLAVGEIAHAMRTLPIAFMKKDNYFTPVALLGIQQGENLFVRETGYWQYAYKPAVFRSYPFALIPNNEGKLVLAYDEDSKESLNEGDENSFYKDNGENSDTINNILTFLTEVHNSYEKTIQICTFLNKYNLFDDWNITVNRGSKKIELNGLYKINETILNSLDANSLFELQNVRALGLAYAHIFSILNVPLLGKLADHKDKLKQSPIDNINKVEEVFSYEDDGNIDLSSL